MDDPHEDQDEGQGRLLRHRTDLLNLAPVFRARTGFPLWEAGCHLGPVLEVESLEVAFVRPVTALHKLSEPGTSRLGARPLLRAKSLRNRLGRGNEGLASFVQG